MSKPPPAKQRRVDAESDADSIQFESEPEWGSDSDYLHLVCYDHTEETFHGLMTPDGGKFLPSSKIVKKARREILAITKKAASLSRVWKVALDIQRDVEDIEVPEVHRAVLEKVRPTRMSCSDSYMSREYDLI